MTAAPNVAGSTPEGAGVGVGVHVAGHERFDADGLVVIGTITGAPAKTYVIDRLLAGVSNVSCDCIDFSRAHSLRCYAFLPSKDK